MQIQRFGAGGDSYVHPVIAVAMLLAVAAMMLVPRRSVVIPFLAAAILIPMDQVLVIGGLHFQMIRVLILFGWIRLFMLKGAGNLSLLAGGWSVLDKALVLWAGFTAVDMVLLWQDSAALTNQLGTQYTVLGIYLLLRFFVRSEEDVVCALKALAWVSAVIAVVMATEQFTAHNPYAYVWAGAAEGARTVMERDGHLRAMGCFAHPLLAGTFGGISLPLFFALWHKRNDHRRVAVVGMAACTAIVMAANSSTPLLAYVGGLFALTMWYFRRRMRLFRWGLVITLVTLHLVMKAPVWALIARIDLTGSSSSYHRYQLVDQFIRRFADWWLVGTKGNASWGWDMWDLANQYVAVGETSGLLPFIFFMATIVYGFKYLGRARKQAIGDRRQEHFVWAVGAALFANVVAFFGISYFDQTMVAWYLLLAIIGAVAASAATARAKAEKSSVRVEVPAVVPSPVLAIPEMRVSDLV
jgi:hypothetical protein